MVPIVYIIGDSSLQKIDDSHEVSFFLHLSSSSSFIDTLEATSDLLTFCFAKKLGFLCVLFHDFQDSSKKTLTC